MNVMAQAHKAAKEFFASVTETGLSYAKVLQIKLRVMHRQFKEECKTSQVEWYSVEGHVIDEENGKEIPVMEGSSKVETAADCVLYYAKNFKKHSLRVVSYLENGAVLVEKPNTNYK